MNEDAVRIWIRRAENDLKTAMDELQTREPATDTVCFHAQQCAEKYLKAFLVFHGQEIPRTHDLSLLLHRCVEIDEAFRVLLDQKVDLLTDYAVQVRYDSPVFPSVDEAREAVRLARIVRDFVREKLASEGFSLS